MAQFVALAGGAMFPKNELRRKLAKLGPPDFDAPDEPHGMLADLPIRVYITTNYDDFMVQALRKKGKDPVQEVCRWNSNVQEAAALLDPEFEPTVERPIVFHLHGHFGLPDSIVLTEDDYLDFLVEISRNPNLLPHQIRRALSRASLLFVGYRMADWNFRVLHRGLVMATERSLGHLSVTVQVPPTRPEEEARAVDKELEYLNQYFGAMNVQVYWGTASDFVSDLRARWREYASDA